MRVFAIVLLVLSSTLVYSQSGGMGSMRDPRTAGSQTGSLGDIEPWLAVTGNYDTYLDNSAGSYGSVRRSVALQGGLSVSKSYRRTVMVLGYSGTGSDYLGEASGPRSGWTSSNVLSLAVSSQLTHRMTFDFSELGGAGNGGFGAGSAGMQAGGLGMLSSMGIASGFLFGGGSTGINPLQNGLVDADYYTQMAYFTSTSAGVGFMLTDRTMLNVSGSGSFVRRDGLSFNDSNMYGANAMISTHLSPRFSTFFGYSYNNIDFIKTSGTTNLHSGFAGISYTLSPRDNLSFSATGGYMDSHYVTTVALPPDVAALLGVSTTTIVSDSNRDFVGGKFSYNHTFQRGGFDLSCNSTIAPGNDLIQLSRTHGCTVSLSRRLTPRFGVAALGGLRRLTGQTRAGGRYDVLTGGLVFSYRMFGGLSLTAGADYRASEVHPSTNSSTGVTANAGLRWTPKEGIHLF